MKKSISGFTIVELLIVIVVIAILAAISIVVYNGIQERARSTSLKSDLTNAAKVVELANANTGSYPMSLPSDAKTSSGNVIQLTTTDEGPYCINGYNQQGRVASISPKGHKEYLCNGALIGSPVGGSIPAVPSDTNLAPSFSAWSITGGMTYNVSTNQVCAGSTGGEATSPLIRVEGSTGARLTVEGYATQPSPNGTPNSRGYYGSLYFAADGTTAAINTSGYSGNGNAQDLPLSTWTTHVWSTATGPNVKYIKFRLYSAPTTYTSNNCYRNPQITATIP